MNPTPAELLLSKLHGVKRNGKGWKAQCPSYDDRTPSLSVAKGDDGQALVRCHTGCSPQDVVAAVGLTLRDLFPDAPSTLSTSTKPRRTREKQGLRRQDNGQPARKAYKTANEAVEALERRRGRRSSLMDLPR